LVRVRIQASVKPMKIAITVAITAMISVFQTVLRSSSKIAT
jgi:hypothetical protein